MRIRIVICGCLSGVICIIPLYYRYYLIEPARVVLGWPNLYQAALLPPWFGYIVLSFCALMLFAFGWVAARWNWSGTWQASLNCGAGSGLLAGCLIYNYIGIFISSLHGQAPILQNFYNPLTEAEGTRILLDAMIKTQTLLSSNFIWIILICVCAGALGGLSSAIDVKDFWGRSPRNPDGWLFRLSAYVMVFWGLLNLLVSVAVLGELGKKLQNTVLQYTEQFDVELGYTFDLEIFLQSTYLIGYLFALIPAGIIAGWFIRLWRLEGKPRIVPVVLMLIGSCVFIWLISPNALTRIENPTALFVGLISFVIFAFYVGVENIAKDSMGASPYLLADWIGYGIGFGIIGGTQTMACVVSYSISTTMIGVMNIPHLVRGGIVEKSPIDQVIQLYSFQTNASTMIIIVSLVIGLTIALIVSFIRRLFQINSAKSSTWKPDSTRE